LTSIAMEVGIVQFPVVQCIGPDDFAEFLSSLGFLALSFLGGGPCLGDMSLIKLVPSNACLVLDWVLEWYWYILYDLRVWGTVMDCYQAEPQ